MKFRALASLMFVAVLTSAGPLPAAAQPFDQPRAHLREGMDSQPMNRAEPGHPKQQPPHPGQQAKGISPKQAVSIAKQRHPGKVLSVQRTNGSYRIKMLHEGRVSYVTVSAY